MTAKYCDDEATPTKCYVSGQVAAQKVMRVRGSLLLLC